MIYYIKAVFGQIFRCISLNSGAILLERLKNLTQIGFPSLRSVKSNRLPAVNSSKFVDRLPALQSAFAEPRFPVGAALAAILVASLFKIVAKATPTVALAPGSGRPAFRQSPW